MALLAERDFGGIGLADIAERAGVSLADACAKPSTASSPSSPPSRRRIDRPRPRRRAGRASDDAARPPVRGDDAPLRCARPLQGRGQEPRPVGAPRPLPRLRSSTGIRERSANGCWSRPASSRRDRRQGRGRGRSSSSMSRRCAPGSTTTIPVSPRPWRRSTAALRRGERAMQLHRRASAGLCQSHRRHGRAAPRGRRAMSAARPEC